MLREKRGIEAQAKDVADALYGLKSEIGIRFVPVVRNPENFFKFATSLDVNADFWALIVGLAALTLVISFQSATFLAPLRWALGTLAVLVFPGYSIQMGIFPRNKDMLLWKRVLLAMGISIAVTGFYATLLDATYQGIVVQSVVIVFIGHSLIFAWFGLLRRFAVLRRDLAL